MALAEEDAESKYKALNQKIEANNKKIRDKQQKEQKVLDDIYVLGRDLKYTRVRLKKAAFDLDYYQTKMRQTETDIKDAQIRYEAKKKAFVNRIVQIYKNKNFGVLEFLFSSKDLVAVVNATHLFEKLIRSDIDTIGEIRADYRSLVQQKKQYRTQKQRIQAIRADIASQQAALKTKKNKQSQYYSLLKKERKKYERQNAELIKSSREFEAIILKKSGKSVLGTGSFIKPVVGWISSRFGFRRHPIFQRRILHTGVDFAAQQGTKIKAADSGRVIFAKRKGGYGKTIIIDHGAQLSTVYAHQSRIIAQRGQMVKKGETIGLVGSTGYSTGPHLHFEIRRKQKPVDPMRYLR